MAAPLPVYAAQDNQPVPVAYEDISPSCLDATVSSLAFKMLSCIPIAGTFSTCFSFIYLDNKRRSHLPLSEAEILQIRKTERDYSLVSVVRNVAELALAFLGILHMHPITCVVFGVIWAYSWIQDDLTVQSFERRQLANAPQA